MVISSTTHVLWGYLLQHLHSFLKRAFDHASMAPSSSAWHLTSSRWPFIMPLRFSFTFWAVASPRPNAFCKDLQRWAPLCLLALVSCGYLSSWLDHQTILQPQWNESCRFCGASFLLSVVSSRGRFPIFGAPSTRDQYPLGIGSIRRYSPFWLCFWRWSWSHLLVSPYSVLEWKVTKWPFERTTTMITGKRYYGEPCHLHFHFSWLASKCMKKVYWCHWHHARYCYGKIPSSSFGFQKLVRGPCGRYFKWTDYMLHTTACS